MLGNMVEGRFPEAMGCKEWKLATPTRQARAGQADGSRSVATQKTEFEGSHAVFSQHGRCEILTAGLHGEGRSRGRRRVAVRAQSRCVLQSRSAEKWPEEGGCCCSTGDTAMVNKWVLGGTCTPVRDVARASSSMCSNIPAVGADSRTMV